MEPQNSLGWVPKHFPLPKSIDKSIYTFLFKVVTPCNLNCDYCYVYQGPDQSWRDKPKFMTPEVAKAAARRIAEHVNDYNLEEVAVTFHGGEPLMIGLERLKILVDILESTIPCKIDFATQTNATLLSPELLDFFVEKSIKIGVSIDGPKVINDTHRRYRNGRGSFNRVMKGINLVKSKPRWEKLLGGYLAVIDLNNSPSEVFHFLNSLGARGFDVLLPDCNHAAPPERPDNDFQGVAYGKWMADFFDTWVNADSDVEVRYFEEIIAMIFGKTSSMEAIGAQSVDLIVVEANGDIEAVDTLKMVNREATSLGLNVHHNSFREAVEHPAIYSRLMGYSTLCTECQSCPILNQCGGGYLPHRYSQEFGFQNPSVYCNDIKFLVSHIARKLETVV